MRGLFEGYEDAVERTVEIAERISFTLDDLRYEYPDEVSAGRDPQEELERLVEAGLSPMAAISSATIRPAEFFGIQATHGQVQAGQVADLVLLSANPILDIRNTRSIVSVISKGQVVR